LRFLEIQPLLNQQLKKLKSRWKKEKHYDNGKTYWQRVGNKKS
jgi:hypothetical protein